MKKDIVAIFVTICLMLCNSSSLAQNVYDTTVIVTQDEDKETDSSFMPQGDTILERFTSQVSSDSTKAYKLSHDFKYMRYLDSLLRKTKGLTVDTISFSNTSIKSKGRILIRRSQNPSYSITAGSFIMTLLWILAILFIGFILYKLFLTESIFKKSLRNIPDEQPEEKTVITPSAYDKLVNDAITNKDFRLAVRYLYLQTLQKLSLSGLINLSPGKTNYEYVNELSGKIHQNEFASLTLNYEYVWFGKFNIGPDIFTRLQNNFRQYHQKI
jgi:hypothetical protein